MATQTTSPKPPRWRSGVIIVLLVAATVLWFLFGYEGSHQDRTLGVYNTLIVGALLLLIWFVFLSRFQQKVRHLGLGIAVTAVGLFILLFEFRGVSGDMRPLFSFRFREKPSVRSTIPAASGRESEKPPASAKASPHADQQGPFPQFQGPSRDGKLPDEPVLNFTRAPVTRWRIPVGSSWSGFATEGRLAVTQEQAGEEELVTAYNLSDGALLWKSGAPGRYKNAIAGEGPRSTPTISNGRVYAMGALGRLRCLELSSGNLLWEKMVLEENGGKVGDWGVATAPLILENLVIVSAGENTTRSLLAFDKESGKLQWKGGADAASYSSPVLLRLGGTNQVVIFNAASVSSHDPSDGKVLWEYPWGKGQPHIAVPLQLTDSNVVISSGYGVGAQLLHINPSSNSPGKYSPKPVWKSNRLKAKMSNFFAINDHLYGLDDGMFACVRADNGELAWKSERLGHGQLLLKNGRILVMAEKGDVVIIEPSSKQYQEVLRFPVFEDKTWNPPALAGPFLLVRNDREAACLEFESAAPK